MLQRQRLDLILAEKRREEYAELMWGGVGCRLDGKEN